MACHPAGPREELATVMEILAYLDPGSASALLAAVLAAIAGVGATIRVYGAKLKDKLFFWKKSEAAGNEAASDVTKADPPDSTPAEK
jgi:hypothetical protein